MVTKKIYNTKFMRTCQILLFFCILILTILDIYSLVMAEWKDFFSNLAFVLGFVIFLFISISYTHKKKK